LIKIRTAKIKDAKEIAQLELELMEHIIKLEKIFEIKKDAIKHMEKRFKQIPSDRQHKLLVAESDGQLVGYVKARIKKRDPIYKIEKMGFIDDVYVQPKYRRQGIAKEFIKQIFAWYKKRGIKYADLFVVSNNETAKTVWKNMGFRGYLKEKYRKI
jgi:ribosomal protein S18 acetylase RimI-like enzyme